ncbi:MAG: hypothetical protein O6852_07655 [Gammaproteobacteria bacterium]|nr:hypothetical protein [Gammaproteobacteria bacterium]
MTTAQDIVINLNDNQAIKMARNIHDRIFSAVDYDTVEKNSRGDDDGKTLLGLSDDQLKTKFDASTSVELSRNILESISNDEGLSAVIADAWEEVQNDDSMAIGIGTVIAVGLMVNLTLFMISSELELNFKNGKLIKHKVDTEAVKAVVELISKTAKIATAG